jgi:RNA polymerase sigma-70 factor (ECF subfamily)
MRYRELLAGLSQLPENNREALMLVVGAGFTCEEAADVLGCAIGTVKSRVSRARGHLLKLLDLDLPISYVNTRAVSRVQYS